MSASSQPVTFVWPGDLHLTEAGLSNHRVAQGMVKEVNDPTGRYTAIPGVDPTVKGTAFC